MTNPPPYSAQWQPPPPQRHDVYLGPPAPNGQPLASFLDRFLAYLIDYVVLFAVTLVWTVPFVIWWMIGFFDQMQQWSENYDPYSQDPSPPPMFENMWDFYAPFFLFMLLSIGLNLVFTYLYFVEFQLKRGGQTIGKRTIKIRVIPTVPTDTLTRFHLFKRWGVQWAAAQVVPMLNLIDGLWQVWDKPLQQCLHDKAAATVVVKVG